MNVSTVGKIVQQSEFVDTSTEVPESGGTGRQDGVWHACHHWTESRRVGCYV